MLNNMSQVFLEKNLYKYGVFLTSNKLSLDKKNLAYLSTWNKENIYGNDLYVHPSESILNFEFENKKIVVVGDVFVAHGYLTLEQNIRNFIHNNDWNYIDNLSGRFVFFIISNDDVQVFTDPMGSKTMYYYAKESCIVGSHPCLIASLLDIDIDAEIKKYISMDEYKTKGTRFLPGDLTMFKDIFGLCPNNYFSTKAKKTIRFWPRANINHRNLEELNKSFYEYFMNFVNFIYKKEYTPVFGLTAGVDTRSVMSPFSKLGKDFYTITWDRAIDINERELINELKDYLGRKHIWLNTKEIKDNESFKSHRDIANFNSGLSRGKSSLTAQMGDVVETNDVFIRGLGGEIIRGMFNRSDMKNRSVRELSNIDFITRLYNTAKITSPSKEYSELTYKYLNGFFERNNINDGLIFNYDLGDLIYWEQRMGMWASNLHNEMDSALKGFSGINSRVIFEISYGLSSEQRFNRQLLLELGKIFDYELCSMPYI